MIEDSAGPIRRRVALRAVRRKARLLVVRVRRAVVQRNVASAAIRRRVRKGPVRVALRALQRSMRPG